MHVHRHIHICVHILYGRLSIFVLPGTAYAEQIMVLPYDEKENEGLER